MNFRFDNFRFWHLNEALLRKTVHITPRGLTRGIPLVSVGMFAALLSGCTLRDLENAGTASSLGELPASWTSSGGSIPGVAVTGWLDDFGSSELKSLVAEAIGENYSLASARARIEQARERAALAGADLLPFVEAGVSTTRSQNLRGANFQKSRANNFNFSLDLSWEVDLWGRVRDLREAELDRLSVETNLYESTRLSLAGNVVKTAFDIVVAGEQVSLSQRNLASLRTNLKILDSRLEAGDVGDLAALEISLSRADIARAESGILQSRRQLDTSRRVLETLLGRYPGGKLDPLSRIPRISRSVTAGLPSELLLRRPDLLAAEARVDAATRELSASRKALLPAIRITGAGGTSTTDEFGDIFDIQNLVWSIGQNLTAPVFQGGRLRANIRLDESERKELVATYADTALTAFREVETALSAEWYLKGQVAALTTAVTESRRAESLSLRDYEQGLVDIITLLESQRRAFDAESSLLGVQLELLKNRVDLYLALGGDFDHLITDKAPIELTAADGMDH